MMMYIKKKLPKISEGAKPLPAPTKFHLFVCVWNRGFRNNVGVKKDWQGGVLKIPR